VGVIQNSAGTRVLKPYSRGVVDSTRPKNGRVRLHHLGQPGGARSTAARGARHGPVSGYQRLSTSAHLSCGTPRVRQPRKSPRPPRLFPNFLLHPPSRYLIDVRRTHAVPSIGRLHPSTHEFMDDAEKGERMKRNLHSCKSIQSGTLNTLHRLRC